MEKKPIRQAICDAASEMQRGADSEKQRAATHALQSVIKDDADERSKALAAYEAHKAYEFAARRIDRLRQELERGEIG